MARLGDYVKINTGKLDANASSTNGQYPFFTCSIEPLKIDSYSYDCECVLVAGNGDLNVKYYNGKFNAYQRTYIIESNNKAVLSVPYLYCFLEKYVETLRKQSIGGVIKYIKLGNLTEAEIPLFNIEKQSDIVKNLKKVNELIEDRKSQLVKLDELIKSRFVELFGEPITNSHNYVLKKYGELFELNAGGTPSKQKPEYWDNGTIPWIGSNMCQNAVIYENDGNYITEEGLNHSSARMFPVDTVLIALVGATIGKTALLKVETTTNQNVLGVRGIRESGYTPEFIFYYTQGLYQKFLNIGDGGFAMASKGFISELPVPLVDLALQEQFAAFVEQTDKSKLAVQQSLEKLETLKKSLMQKYFG